MHILGSKDEKKKSEKAFHTFQEAWDILGDNRRLKYAVYRDQQLDSKKKVVGSTTFGMLKAVFDLLEEHDIDVDAALEDESFGSTHACHSEARLFLRKIEKDKAKKEKKRRRPNAGEEKPAHDNPAHKKRKRSAGQEEE